MKIITYRQPDRSRRGLPVTHVTGKRVLNSEIHSSPRMVAQRHQLERVFGMPVQRQGPEEEELLQGKFVPKQTKSELAVKLNDTGLPDNLKSGIESLSGISMDRVKVHYNSSKPAQLNALAYAQGTDIHVASGQEQHLPHEAWHLVQQAQGRVKPTMKMKDGVPVNDDQRMEHEADVMGAKAISTKNNKQLKSDTESVKATSPFGNRSDLKERTMTPQSVKQFAFNQDAITNITAARNVLNSALNNYTNLDGQLDGNRVNWGYTVDTWNALRNNITKKTNHMRGQGISDALESLSWKKTANNNSVTGPGGAKGVDLRVYSNAGMGANRLAIEVKHAGSTATMRSQIVAAITAHGANQTVKIYLKPAINIPNNNDTWHSGMLDYTVRALNYVGDPCVTVIFYRDNAPTVEVQRKIVSYS